MKDQRNSLQNRLTDSQKSRSNVLEKFRAVRIHHAKKSKRKNHLSFKKNDANAQETQHHDESINFKIEFDLQKLSYQYRNADSEKIYIQKWASELANALLNIEKQKKNVLFLIWPSELHSISIIHALASLANIFCGNLFSLRTVLYPAKLRCQLFCQNILVERAEISNFYRDFLDKSESGELKNIEPITDKLVILRPLNNIHLKKPEVSNPSLAEIIPTFFFSHEKKKWIAATTAPLSKTLAKVTPLKWRQELRSNMDSVWYRLDRAPNPLMSLKFGLQKNEWRHLLASSESKDQKKPSLLLFDATNRSVDNNFSIIRHIQNFFAVAEENSLINLGKAIFTDNPVTFFELRKQLSTLGLRFTEKIFITHGEDMFSEKAPDMCAKIHGKLEPLNCEIGIVDKEASGISYKLYKIAKKIESKDSNLYQAILEMYKYVRRLSNMPAGYEDLTRLLHESHQSDFLLQKNSWSCIKSDTQNKMLENNQDALLNELTVIIKKIDKLVDAWDDSTPLALRILSKIEGLSNNSGETMAVVTTSNQAAKLLQKFLQRKFGDKWLNINQYVTWHSFREIKVLVKQNIAQIIFAGFNLKALYLVLTRPEISAKLTILMPHSIANSLSITLNRMQQIREMQIYEPRIQEMATALENKLGEIPNTIDFEKLPKHVRERFDIVYEGTSTSKDYPTYKFELEDSEAMYCSTFVYRYTPDKDPPFSRCKAEEVKVGEYILNIKEELRDEIESTCKNYNIDIPTSSNDQLRWYREYVDDSCQRLFGNIQIKADIARKIKDKMIIIDSNAKKCTENRIQYWLFSDKENKAPHASRDLKFFKLFCQSLEISEELAELFWVIVKKTRCNNQYFGRQLSVLYTGVLFSPEDIQIYKNLPQEVVKKLQRKALDFVYQVTDKISI